MPKPISWLDRLPDIRKAVGGSSSSHFDRGDIGRLFQLQKSGAGKILGLLPRSEKLGSSHLVEKLELMNFLEAVAKAKDKPAYLKKLRRDGPKVSRRRKIQLRRQDDGTLHPENPPPPDAINFSLQKIEIKGFYSAEQAIELLLWAAIRISSDPEAFESDYCAEKGSALARLAPLLDSPEQREKRRQYLAWCESTYGSPWFGLDADREATGSSGGTSAGTSM